MSQLRYHVGSLTGYRAAEAHGEPITEWYLHDSCNMCLPVAVFRDEEKARRHCFFLNAEERIWEKSAS